jgi:cell division protein FtsB
VVFSPVTESSRLGLRMRNLVFGILVASTAILGFFAYQSSQKVVALEADLTAKAEAVASLEAEKAALSTEVATLQSQMAEMIKAAGDAAAAAVEATITP